MSSKPTGRHIPHAQASVAEEHTEMILDGTKIQWHMDRVDAWKRGERIAPITVDMALTRACQYSCSFCYAMLQENARSVITKKVMTDFLDDSARMGVRGISLVSDGESTLSSTFDHTVTYGSKLGISMAVGTNAYSFTKDRAEKLLEHFTYLRVNFSAGEKDRYCQIMGVQPEAYDKVVQNVRDMVEIKRKRGLDVTIGFQMVLMPQDGDQIMPFAKLGKELGVDYAIVKHCSDDEHGSLGVDYSKYEELYGVIEEAQALSTDDFTVAVKWSKILDQGKRSYQRCYGAPFLLQLSGSGLVAPCAALFNDRYAKFHIGNICEERWYDIWQSDRYWEVMSYLGSDDFDAQRMCGALCLQHKVNEALDQHVKEENILTPATGPQPMHINYV
jgi:MoaA/NifB/PqqE/SkfB family radical SAM enzyme